MHSQRRCDNTCPAERRELTMGCGEETGLAARGTDVWQAVRGCRMKQRQSQMRLSTVGSLSFRRKLSFAECSTPQAPVHGCCGLHQSHQTTEQLATKSKSVLSSSFQTSARRPRPFDSQCAVLRRRQKQNANVCKIAYNARPPRTSLA